MGAGVLVRSQRDFVRAGELLEASVALHRELGDAWGMAYSLSNLGFAAWYQGDYARAVALQERSLAVLRDLDPWGATWPLSGLGVALHMLGDHERAASFLDQALALGRRVGDPWVIARILAFRGHLAHAQADHDLVAELASESLTLCQKVGDTWGIALALHSLALSASARGQAVRAAHLFGAAEGVRDAIGAPLMPGERAGHDQDLNYARAVLGALAFAVAWTEGRGWSLQQASAYALERTVSPRNAGRGDQTTADPQ
jgi:tetratricopeptide (TPR) repeat protein